LDTSQSINLMGTPILFFKTTFNPFAAVT